MTDIATQRREGTTILEIVRAAASDADQEFAEHILWSRTPFPFGKVTPKQIYKAASRVRRAAANDIALCDWCDQRAADEDSVCANCRSALGRSTNG